MTQQSHIILWGNSFTDIKLRKTYYKTEKK